jgi:alpha-ketoglutarate-dependent taurine dioxygenase
LNLEELQTKGWTLVDGISSQVELLELGRALGCPVPAPNGEFVKEIRRIPADKAPAGSQSSIYGTGFFPLHTDTVFWPLPVRYVLLRCYGDTRRPTTVMSFSNLLRECDAQFYVFAQRSVWLVGAGSKRFYCSLQFREGDLSGWRYDFDLMSPANDAAVQVDRVLRPLVIGDKVDSITWSDNTAVVLSNWTTLHGRGSEPPDEGIRVIERLYVR